MNLSQMLHGVGIFTYIWALFDGKCRQIFHTWSSVPQVRFIDQHIALTNDQTKKQKQWLIQKKTC